MKSVFYGKTIEIARGGKGLNFNPLSYLVQKKDHLNLVSMV